MNRGPVRRWTESAGLKLFNGGEITIEIKAKKEKTLPRTKVVNLMKKLVGVYDDDETNRVKKLTVKPVDDETIDLLKMRVRGKIEVPESREPLPFERRVRALKDIWNDQSDDLQKVV